jgi:hypothetical protein
MEDDGERDQIEEQRKPDPTRQQAEHQHQAAAEFERDHAIDQ